MSLSALSFSLLLVMGALTSPTENRPLLAMEVRFHGDVDPWRWWCRAPSDPLAEEIIGGFAEGFNANQKAMPIVALPSDTAAVHPMYCTEPLDNDLAMNLAGLLDATVSHSGLLEVGPMVAHAEPKLLTTKVSFHPFTENEGVYFSPDSAVASNTETRRDQAAENLSETHSGQHRNAARISRTAVAANVGQLAEALREAARSLGRTVYLLRLEKMKARGSDRQLWFFVRGVSNSQNQRNLAAKLQALFPSGFQMSAVGFKGESAAFVLEAPQGQSTDLLGMLQARIGGSTAGLPPLLLEGFDTLGIPLFITVETDAASNPPPDDSRFP